MYQIIYNGEVTYPATDPRNILQPKPSPVALDAVATADGGFYFVFEGLVYDNSFVNNFGQAELTFTQYVSATGEVIDPLARMPAIYPTFVAAEIGTDLALDIYFLSGDDNSGDGMSVNRYTYSDNLTLEGGRVRVADRPFGLAELSSGPNAANYVINVNYNQTTTFTDISSGNRFNFTTLSEGNLRFTHPLGAYQVISRVQIDDLEAYDLAEGRTLVAWLESAVLSFDTYLFNIFVTTVDGSGARSGTTLLNFGLRLPTEESVAGMDKLQLVRLSTGDFLLCWRTTYYQSTKDPEYKVQRISADGAKIGQTIVLDTDAARDIDIDATAGGGFVLTSSPFAAEDWQSSVYIQEFDDDFQPIGSALILPNDNLKINLAAESTVLQNGDIAVVWTSGYGPTPMFEGKAEFVIVRAAGENISGSASNETLRGSNLADSINGNGGNDIILGNEGNDTLLGGDGIDTLNGGAGDDFLYGGTSATDLRDVIFGGEGNDSADGGAGNDELNGGGGHDTLAGGLGSDTLIGNDGNDVLAGGGGSDLMFGNAGNDYFNGGFGFDRMNGGTGADVFFHLGVADHGSDWIQDYNAAEGDVLMVGIAGATRSQFQVNFAATTGAGTAGVQEAFVIFRPTGQVLFALVDGAGQSSINISLGGEVADLLV